MKTNQSNINVIKFLILLITLAFLTGVSAEIPISSPCTLNSAGTYVLTANISCTSGTAITIDCDNVVIDGNGFSIIGNNLGSCGISSSEHTNITIKNVVINTFKNSGIELSGSSSSAITNNTLVSNGGDDFGGSGISLSESSNNTIRNNILSSNGGDFTGYGISLYGSSSNTIADNILTSNKNGIGLLNGGNMLNFNNISNNTLTSNINSGISLSESSSNTIADNTLTLNGYGISLSGSSSNTIINNILSLNGYGISLNNPFNTPNFNNISNNNLTSNTNSGISLSSSSSNTIINNILSLNGEGIELFESSSNTIINNILSSNTYGILVYSSVNNEIFTNRFNNSNNIRIYDSQNYWNTSAENGGGNYWFNSLGTGYSESNFDRDGDGFCDEPHDLMNDGLNMDYFPLLWDKNAPNVIVNSPTNGTTYYTNTISINITVNDALSGISSVTAEIEGVRNVTLTLNGTYYTGSTGPLSSGNYSVTIIANDTAGNINQTTIQNIEVLDLEPPVISNVTVNPNPVNAGEELSFTVVATDNFGISSVTVNGSSLDYLENNTYIVSMMRDLAIGNYSWELKVMDEASNEKIEYLNFTVIDIYSPVISNVTITPNPVNITEYVTISADITDNGDIDSVSARINGITYEMTKTIEPRFEVVINTSNFTSDAGYFTVLIAANDTAGNSVSELKSINVLDLEINNALDYANVSIETDAWENVNSTGITTNETNGLNLTTIPTINGDALVIPEIEGVEIQVTNITFEIIENVTNAADSLNVSNITNETGMNNTANQILNSMQELLNEGFVISNETQNTTTETVTIGSTTTTKAVARISFVAENTSAKGFVTVRIPIGDLTLSSVIVNNGTENITLTQTPNNSTGWYRIPVSGVLEVILVKDPGVMITLEKTLSAVTAVTTTPSRSGGGGSSYSAGLADGFSSSAIKNAVSNANVIYGSDIDMEFALKLRENVQTSENYELTRNTIIVGGPLANGFANRYDSEFGVQITNDYPGENRGVIQVKNIEVRDGNIIKTYQIIYIAGSDRFGTLAALEYFKTLDELPVGPITVEWTENGPVLVE